MTSEATPISQSASGASGQGVDFEALYLRAVEDDQAKDELLALLAHEIRNPLNALQASVEVLNRAAPGSPEATSARNIIARQVKRLAQLIDSRLPALGAASQTPIPAAAEASSLRVGVIEDNPDALFGLCALLELDGHAVVTAGDGPDGLAMLRREAPDVAIVDIGLPGFDGYEVARRCRSEGFAGRLIALSGYGSGEDPQRSRAAGFEAHLVKPVDPEKLAHLLCR